MLPLSFNGRWSRNTILKLLIKSFITVSLLLGFFTLGDERLTETFWETYPLVTFDTWPAGWILNIMPFGIVNVPFWGGGP